MKRLIGFEFRSSVGFLSGLGVGVLLFAVLMVAVYPPLKDQFDAMMKTVPAFMRPFVQAQAGVGKVEGFIGVAFTHPVILGLFASWPIVRGARAIAGEIERGTLGWMLSYPIGRGSFLLAKTAVLLLGLAILSVVLIGGMLLGLLIFDIPHAGYGPFLWAALATWLLYAALGGLTLWASAASNEGATAARFGTAIFLGSFLLNYVAQLWEPLKPYRFLSLFAYYDPKALLLGTELSLRDAGVLSGVLIIGVVGAVLSFRSRNLSI